MFSPHNPHRRYGKKYAAALMTLVAGGALAMCFPRAPQPSSPQTPPQTPPQAPPLAASADGFPPPSGAIFDAYAPPPAAFVEPSEISTPAKLATPPPAELVREEPLASVFAPPSPPEIAASFQPRGRHLKVPTETSRPPKIQEAASPSPALEPPRPLRRHRVVDGDSLESLAERYLKDRSRYLEIYQLNREVLSDWRLLPVGAELTIPPRIRSATIRTGSTQPPVFEGLAPVLLD